MAYYLWSVVAVSPRRMVLVVVAHEEPHAIIVAQNMRLHKLAQRTAKAHRHLDSFRHRCSPLVEWNVG